MTTSSPAAVAVAVVVLGVPIVYVARKSLERRSLAPLALSIGAFVPLALFPTRILPILWLVLLCLVAGCLAIVAVHCAFAVWHLWSSPATAGAEDPPTATIAVLIPVRDEARVVEGCLDAVLQADHPRGRLDVVVIDDCSMDETARLVAAYADVHPEVRLVRSVNPRGKAAALNTGIAMTDADFVCVLDADHRVAKNFFATVLCHFAHPRVGGVQALQRARNWSQNPLTRLAALDSYGWQFCFLQPKSDARLASVSFGSGCVFRTSLLREIGGFNTELVTEDVEASLRLYEAGYRVVFEAGTFTTDELPADLRSFMRQRYRWARGTTQAIPLHWRRFWGGRATLREKTDVSSFVVLLGFMVLPYCQLATYSLSAARGLHLRGAVPALLLYVVAIVTCFFIGGIASLRRAERRSSEVAMLLATSAGMCVYYGVLLAPINFKAFVDEFLLHLPANVQKTTHLGEAAPASSSRLPKLGREIPPEVALLLAASRQDVPPERALALQRLVERVRWPFFARLAVSHGVAALVHATLGRSAIATKIPADALAALATFRRGVLARNLQLQIETRAAMAALADEGVDVAPLKGAALVDRVYSPDLRPMWDVDLLVRPEQRRIAGRVLEDLGYEAVANPTLNGSAWFTQRSYVRRDIRAVIDLHWELVNIHACQRIRAHALTDVWARAVPAERQHVFELVPEDTLVHSAIHAALHHNLRRFLQLVDLAELLGFYEGVLDWPLVLALAERDRLKSPVYAALWLGRQRVGAPVPDDVLRQLRPSRARAVVQRSYMPSAQSLLRESPPREELRWGLSSLLLADTLRDSMRAARSNISYALAAKGWDAI